MHAPEPVRREVAVHFDRAAAAGARWEGVGHGTSEFVPNQRQGQPASAAHAGARTDEDDRAAVARFNDPLGRYAT
jgi:hypothetical protein